MITEWKPSGEYKSVTDFVTKKSGATVDDLLHPVRIQPTEIQGLQEAAYKIVEAIQDNKHITIVGDYDVDGIAATAIMTKLIRFLGAEPETVIPKRFTDGYGLSANIIEAITPGLIVTVDNGITACREVALAKYMENDVIIIDHHQPQSELPLADVVVDPHIDPAQNGFHLYCGAGLALKMAEIFLYGTDREDETNLIGEMTVLAAIATIADVVPLIGDNRRIVKEGLRIANDRKSTLSPGVAVLLSAGGSDIVDEETIGFKLAPLINAPGRLYNAGGTSTLKALLCTDMIKSMEYTSKLIEINDKRKKLVAESVERVEEIIETQSLGDRIPLCVLVPGLPEGITGIITGKLAEQFKRPAFVFTEGEDNIIKGSGRSFAGFDLSKLIEHIKPLTIKAGGHEGAAGVSVDRNNYEAVVEMMESYLVDSNFSSEELSVSKYDIEVKSQDISETLAELKQFAPFGAGVPRPVFSVQDFQTRTVDGSHFRTMGAEGNHLKIFGEDFHAIGFGQADKYKDMNCPADLILYGALGENTFNGSTSIQFMLADFEIKE